MALKRTLVVFLLLLFAPSVYGQTVLHFPRVIANSGVFTGLAVGNPTTTEVSVTFTAFQPDGTPFAADLVQNPVTMKIPAGGQVAKLFGELFGPRDFNGWVQATSSTKGLTGFFLNGNGALTDLDGAGAIEATPEFVLPLAAEDTSTKTEITIVNVNGEPSSATVTLYGADGAIIATKDLSLPARGLVRQTLRGIFSDTNLSAASHAKVKSDRPLVGHEVVADYTIAGTPVRRETIALSGQRATTATSYILPQFVTGGGWLSLIGIVNAGGVGQEVTFTVYKEDGTVWNVPSNPKRISLEGNGALRTTAGEMFGFPSDTLATGWIEARSSLGFLSSYIAYGNTTTPSFAAVAGTEISAASRFEVFSQVAEGGGFFTGLTVVNPGTQDANVEFYTLRPDGTTVGRSTFTVKSKQRVGRLFSELLPASLLQVGGWAFLRSSQPVVGAVLFGATNGYALANVPQQIPAGDFIPPAQTTSAISGAVRAGGELIADVQITLSGPVTATTATDGLGRYTFPQLPSGDYKVTAVRPGAQFVPSERAVSVNRQNMDGVDFEGGGITPANAPSIQFISPTSAFAGNRAFNIRVLGSNFTPTSIIKLDNQPVLTAYISAAELQAIIPASQLSKAGTLQLTVETPPPGGGASAKLTFTINPVPSDPLIEGRAPVGSYPAGVAIDATRNTALVTNQSSDSVTVLDLKTLDIKGTIVVGRSPAEGIAMHRAKNMALVANPGSDNISVIDLRTNQEQKIKVGHFPVAIAVNPITNKALVTNRDDNSVTVIDLDTLGVSGQIAVGTRPLGVAVQPRFNQAVVTNSGSNDVWMIDLNTGTVMAKIPVGQFPRGVAINTGTNVAVVANANSNDVYVLDLNSRAVAFTVKVETGPTGVAIHELTNTALITNSGIARGSTDYGVPTRVSVLDIAGRTIARTIPVGSAAFGIDIDQESQRAVVANFGSNDVTLIRVPNPRPRVDDVNPRTFPAGSGTFTIVVRGVGFVPTSVVTINGQTLPTTFVSSTELRAEISAATLQQLLQVRRVQLDSFKANTFAQTQELNFNVSVSNPEPGGGDAPPPADPQVNRIVPQNAAPVLVSMTPTEVTAGTGSVTLSLSGNNFNGTSVINFGTSQHSPANSTGTSMTVTIPANLLVAGSYPVSITNPPPGGGTSAALTFQVNAQANPSPTVSGVSPISIPAGSGAVNVTVQGSGFNAATTASLGSVRGTVSGNSVTFALPASETANPGTLSGIISNPPPGGGSASFSMNILNGTPTVSGFSPGTGEAGAASIEIRVNGTNFRAGSQITMQGTPIPTQFGSATQLIGTIPEAFLRRSGDLRIGVTNPPPGGGSAEGGAFTITSALPALTGVNPSRGLIQLTPLTVQLSGSGFAGNSAASIGATRLATVFESSTSLTVTIPPALLTQAGLLDIVVTNPAPGGGTSQAVRFAVENPVPVIESVTPQRFRGDQRDVVLTVTGRNFVQGTTIYIGDHAFPTTVESATQVSAPIPPPLPLGRQPVTVLNPVPGGGASNAIQIEVTSLLPVINTVTNLVALGQTIHVTGTNFGPGSVVLVRGVAAPTTVISETQLDATIPPTLTVGAAEVVVRNPSTTNEVLQSNVVSITIANPAPAITSLEPATALANRSSQRITIHGTGFVPASQVQVDSATVASTYTDPTTLSFVLPSIARATAAAIEVINPGPGGGTSNRATLPLTNVTPTISTISPTSGTANTTVGLTVNGTDFVEGAVVNFGSTQVTATFLSTNSLFANVTVAGTTGAVSVSVTNPGGATSNAVSFTITAPPPPPPPVVPQNPAPSISGLSPSSVMAGSAAISLTITGSNFIAASSVLFGPMAVTVTSQTSTYLIVSVPASSLATSGSVVVTVTNPAPGGGSATAAFAINAATPTTLTLNPSPIFVQVNQTTTLSVGINQAQSSNLTVNLSRSNSNAAFVVNGADAASASVTIAAGATSASIDIHGLLAGTTDITAAAPGLSSITVTANMIAATGSFTVTPSDVSVAVGGAVTVAVTRSNETLSVPLTIGMSVAPTAYATVSPSLTFPANSSTVTATVTGVAASDSASPRLTVAGPDAPSLLTGRVINFVPAGIAAPNTVDLQSFVSGTSTQISFPDDGYTQVTLPFAFPFYGTNRTTAYVGTNGYITFDSGDRTFSWSNSSQFLTRARIAVLATDLYAVAGSRIFTNILTIAGRQVFVATYEKAGLFGSTSLGPLNTMQIALFDNGAIQLNYIAINNAVSTTEEKFFVGISPGGTFTSPQPSVLASTNLIPSSFLFQLFRPNFPNAAINVPITVSEPPTLSSITPNTGLRGAELDVTLSGTNFITGNTSIEFNGEGLTANSVSVVDSNTVKASLRISATAPLGNIGVKVRSGGVLTSAVNFNVRGTDATWVGGASRNWSVAGNWSTGHVPTASESALIPASASNQPILTADASVLDLVVEPGATLSTSDGFTLTAAGNVFAGTTITGAGTVAMTGSAASLGGIVPNLAISGNVTPVRPVTVNGNLSISAGSFSVGGKVVTVNGSFSTLGGGVFRMLNSADALTVTGNATFGGGSTTGLLTAGVLNVAGNFTQSGESSSAFAASGTHKTKLNGTAAQSIGLYATSNFQDLEIANASTSGVSVSGSAKVLGNLSVSGLTSGTGTLDVKGNVTTASGSTVSVANINIGGTLSASGTFAPGTAAFTGVASGGSRMQGTIGGTVKVTGSTTLLADATISGSNSLTIDGAAASLDISGSTLTIGGNLSTTNGGVLKMTQSAAAVTVSGNATFGGGSTTGLLTAGVLTVNGDFSQSSAGAATAFAPSGTHKTKLGASAAHTINFASPGSSKFKDLELANTANLTLQTDAAAEGQLIRTLTTNATVLGGGKTLTVAGVNLTNLVLDNVLLVSNGGSLTKFDNVTFQNYSASATRLQVQHPGASTAFTFNNLTFSGEPTTGFYIDATDTNTTDGNVLTIRLQGASATALLTHMRTSGNAVILSGAAPTLATGGISPASGAAGSAVSINLTGTNFVTGATAVIFSGTGVNVTSLVVNSTTSITAVVVLAGATGSRNVSIVTDGGPSNALAFTINANTISAATQFQSSHFAGTTGGPGSVDGSGSAARFNRPTDVWSDGSNVFVADSDNFTIRKITSAGVVSTLAGTLGVSGFADGPGATAKFGYLAGIWGDATNLYVTDKFNHVIRQVLIADGTVSTLAGAVGISGSADGTSLARFNEPFGIWGDATATSLYVTDQGFSRVRKITISSGAVTTLSITQPAGMSVTDLWGHASNLYIIGNEAIWKVATSGGTATVFAGTAGISGAVNGTGTVARFSGLHGISGDGTNLYVADSFNNTIRQVSISGAEVTTLAGLAGVNGFGDGTGSSATFFEPRGIGATGGALYVADSLNHTIRKTVISTAAVSTIAGKAAEFGTTDATSTSARFAFPTGVWGDGTNLYVAELGNHTIRKIVIATGAVSTFAGTSGSAGSTNGTGTSATFNEPVGLWGDGTNLYVSELGNHTIRKVVIATREVTTLAGSPVTAGSANGTGAGATFNQPIGLWGDGVNLYIAESGNGTIRKIVIATGVVTTLATITGSGDPSGFIDGLTGIWGDGINLYVGDQINHVVRTVSISGGTIGTLAGTVGTSGTADGLGAAALFKKPAGIWGDGTNLFVTDIDKVTVRKIVISGATVTTIGGVAGLSGSEDGIGAAMRFSSPVMLWGDGSALYVSDAQNHAIRKLVPYSSPAL